MNSKKESRRRFLKKSAGLAAFTVGVIRSAEGQSPSSETHGARPRNFRGFRAVGERSRFVTTARTGDARSVVNHEYWVTPLQDLYGIITPAELHYQKNHGGIPDLDPEQHRLLIHGLVERPVTFTMKELKRLPSVSRIYFLECAGNGLKSSWKDAKTAQDAYGRASCSEWTGVPLSLVLKEVGLKKEAKWLLADGEDEGHWLDCFPVEKAMDDALLAYGQNGDDLRPEQGYPLRLFLPGYFGSRCVKWLRQIKVVDRRYLWMHQNLTRVWDKENVNRPAQLQQAENAQPVRSVITFPSGGQSLSGPGYYQITGIAWSGRGTIRRVEISTDGGKSWKDAALQEPVLPKAFTRFRLDWNWNGEEVVLQSRCADDRGNAQPTLAELSKSRGVSPDYWKTHHGMYPFNPVHSWGINREGSVYNAIA